MKTVYIVLLAVYIAFMVGFSASMIGHVPTCDSSHAYGFDLPLTMFLLLVIPSVLSYQIGKEERTINKN